ncbi:MAG TPA: hypothetical protein VLF40_04680 [Candidatus Saccharimonadales bacterium]|nr:hypothetical protein [Candidatus Saccharimonadales bacterium]
MGSITTSEVGPEHVPWAGVNEIDRGFMEWFEEDQELNGFANERAAEFVTELHALLETNGHPVESDPGSSLHFELKKLVFLFTNPDDFENTIELRDVMLFFVVLYARAGKDLGKVPAVLSDFTYQADEVYLPRLAEAIEPWNSMQEREHFWLAWGMATTGGSGPNIPAQSRIS